MAFRPGFAPQFGFHQSPQIYFNPMLGRSFNPHVQQHQQQHTPPVRPTPVTTVFVGNISDKCTNEFMQQMLQECGVVSSWKRIQGSNGKYQAFGFCDYDRPEGTLRSLRVLNEFQIGDKKLVVKAEDKVREDLRKWAIDQRREEGKPDLPLSKEELPADDDDMKKDEEVRLKILNWIETDHPQLLTLAEDGELSDKEAKEKKEKDSKNRDKDDSRSKVSDRRRGRSRSPVRGRSDNDRHRGRSRSPKHKRNRRRSRSSSGSNSSSGSSSDSTDSSRSRSRSHSPRKSKKRKERSPSRNRDSEDSEDARERKALKKMIREKEHNYTGRLKKWEKREKEQAKKYEKEERQEKDKKKNTMKEAKKLKNFLEDYDDEKDDPKYYKHSSLFQRKREFEREREADQKDRLREQQEIEELKRQIMEGDKDAEAAEKEARKQHQEQEEAALRKLRADSGSPNPHQPLGRREGDDEEDSSSSSDDGSDDEEGHKKKDDNASPGSPSGGVNGNGNGDVPNGTSGHVTPATVATPVSAPGSGSTHQDKWKSISSPVVMALDKKDIKSPATVPGPSKREHSAKLNGVFGEEDDDDATARKRMRPVHFTKEDRMETMTNEERKKLVAELVARIPTVKEEIFAFSIDWTFVDKPMIDQRIKPWVSKKICEFIGEEDNALIDFICEKVIAKVAPSTILDDIKQILDDDAEVFVVKMWRFLIYESEAKKGGLPSQSSSKSTK